MNRIYQIYFLKELLNEKEKHYQNFNYIFKTHDEYVTIRNFSNLTS